MRQYTFFIALFFFFASLHAQRFDGGLTAGFSASQVDGDTYAGFNKGGLTAGVYAETALSGDFFGRFEIKYTGKGAARQDGEDNSFVYKRTLHYMELPVILGYEMSDVISFHGGLAPAYLFHSHQEGTDLATGEVPGYRNFDLGWLLGAGYAFNDVFSVELRYTYSLLRTTIQSKAGVQYSWLARQLGYNVGNYNNVVTLGVYYQINR